MYVIILFSLRLMWSLIIWHILMIIIYYNFYLFFRNIYNFLNLFHFNLSLLFSLLMIFKFWWRLQALFLRFFNSFRWINYLLFWFFLWSTLRWFYLILISRCWILFFFFTLFFRFLWSFFFSFVFCCFCFIFCFICCLFFL